MYVYLRIVYENRTIFKKKSLQIALFQSIINLID